MKSNSIKAFAFSIAVLGAANGFGQTQAVTDPVGFITLNIAGGGSIASPKLSLVSATLTRPILYQGVITDISGVTITVSATPTAPWAAGSFVGANGSHYVEIISTAVPTRSGTMSDIVTTPSGNTLTTSGDLSVNQAAIGDTIRVRKDVTISDLFGPTNSAGLLSSDDPAAADEILIYNGASSVAYYYYIGDPMNLAGWYKADDFAPSANVPIAPNEAVVVKRKAATPITLTSVGSVKTGNSIFAVTNGLNVLGTASAKGITLDESGLRTGNDTTGVNATEDPAIADEVILYNGPSPVSYFYYVGDPMNVAGWYKADDFAPSGSVAIAPGTSFVVKRKGGGAFNWALPSPATF